MDNFFSKLENEEYFCDFVSRYFQQLPVEMADILGCQVEIDPDLVQFAHGEYVANINRLAVLLDSADPDHYKRAGSLLHAFYTSRVISKVSFVDDLDDIENGFGPVYIHYKDVNGEQLDLARFYEEYHNELAAFMFAFQCCASYEPDPPRYDFPFLRTMCVYMGRNSNLSLETFFMLFKAIMHR